MLQFKHRFFIKYSVLIILLGSFFYIYNLIRLTLKYDPKKEYYLANNFSYEINYSQDEILDKLSRKFFIDNEQDKVPILIKSAFISAEDKRFLKHNGVDIIGSFRAFINNINSGYIKEGGSTITQQVARLIFLNSEVTLTRKIKEIIISLILEYKYTKNQILKLYLNKIYLGEGAYGINEASQTYFGKLINDLTLSEIALIAGLAPAPNFYSPYQNYELAKENRNKILKKMYADGYINSIEYTNALKEKIIIINKKNNLDKLLSKFILNESRDKINLDKNNKIDNHFIINSSIEEEWQNKAQRLSKKLLPEGIEMGLISIESDTGLIKTMLTSKYPQYNEFNRVTSAFRPLSSTFKIIPYCLALIEDKNLSDIYYDLPHCWNDYCPKNYSNIYRGKTTLVDAFKTSSNIVPIKISEEFGLNKIINLARLFGLDNKKNLKPYLAIAIGAHEDSLINITNAYSIINNKGEFIKPSILKKIELKDGEIIWENKSYAKRIIDKSISYKLNYLLEQSVMDGNGIAASIDGRKVSGKTGTSDQNRDIWFIGSIDNITTGIWIGFDDNRSTNFSSGTAANFWRIYVSEINI